MEVMASKNNSQEALMKQLMSYDFVAHELTLFLDTHPTDMKALEMHSAVSKKAMELRKEYEDAYGPLTASANLSTEKWAWIEGPWPWENK